MGTRDVLHTTFINIMSHELRTPVQSILGYASLLDDGTYGVLAPEQKHALEGIATGARALKTLAEHVSVLLAAEAGTKAVKAVALERVVAEVAERYRALAAQSQLALNVSLSSDVPPILGDRYHLHHLVECLLDNAVKFTPPGGQVDVRVYAEPDCVSLTVADTGIGIEDTALGRIFDLFYQADSSLTRRYGGGGMGLAVVKAVVDEHRGQITVVSQPGRGSRFTIGLPVLSSVSDSPRGLESVETR